MSDKQQPEKQQDSKVKNLVRALKKLEGENINRTTSGLATNYFDADNLIYTLKKIYEDNFRQEDMKVLTRYKELKESGKIIIDAKAKEPTKLQASEVKGSLNATAVTNSIMSATEMSAAKRLLKSAEENNQEVSIKEDGPRTTFSTKEKSVTISPFADKGITTIPKWLNDKLESSGVNKAISELSKDELLMTRPSDIRKSKSEITNENIKKTELNNNEQEKPNFLQRLSQIGKNLGWKR